MKRPVITLASLALLAGCAPKTAATVDPAQVRVYVPEPVGKKKKTDCQGTCQVEAPEILSEAATDALLAKVAAMPVGSDSLELDTLLFHDHETRHRLDEKAVAISPEWETFLRRELVRRNVTVAIRVIDDTGTQRASVEGNWEIGVRAHHMVHDVQGVPPFEASGTLVRVGREHLWVRM